MDVFGMSESYPQNGERRSRFVRRVETLRVTACADGGDNDERLSEGEEEEEKRGGRGQQLGVQYVSREDGVGRARRGKDAGNTPTATHIFLLHA